MSSLPPQVLAAHITLIVGFVLFAILHTAWLIYIWRLDYKWRYALALQRECGKNVMERDTVRWNMNQVFNNDRTLKSLKEYSITLVSIYPIAFVAVAYYIGDHYYKKHVPLTNFDTLEKLQNLPTHFYYNAVALLLLFITMGVIAKYFGSNPRKNKLKNMMTPYVTSLDNVEKTLRLIKNRAARGSTQFDHEQELQERIAKRIAIVNNAESKEMGKAMMDSMDPKEWIGYLQFAEDAASTALCRYVKEDIKKFTDAELTTFTSTLSKFITNIVPTQLVATNATTNSRFGHSVSISEDGKTIAIAAPSNGTKQGYVYIYTWNGTTWSEFTITSNTPNDYANNYFGKSVALSGDGNTLAVGAPVSDETLVNSGPNELLLLNYGVVYIYKKTLTNGQTNWNQIQILKKSNFTKYGLSVALSKNGNVLATCVNDYFEAGTGTESLELPRTYVGIFTLSGTQYTEVQRIDGNTVIGTKKLDHQTHSTSLSHDGNTLAIGVTNLNRVLVYTRASTTNTWVLQQSLFVNDDISGFGYSVSMTANGNMLAIGASGGENKPGYAYVFTRTGTNWTQQARIQSSDHNIGDYLGFNVAISPEGTTLAVGSFRDDHSGKTNAGSAYIYIRSGNQWLEQQRFQGINPDTDDWFGVSVALSSSQNDKGKHVFVVGVKTDDTTQGADSGSAYVFEGRENMWVNKESLNAFKNTFNTQEMKRKYPYFYQYVDALTENTIPNFVDTWWEPVTRNGERTLRVLDDEGVWTNTITPKICQYWDATWGWNNKLKEVTYGDPSPKMKQMMRHDGALKLYFWLTFTFILSIIYMYVPKGTLLPLSFVALLLVFVIAYLTRFM